MALTKLTANLNNIQALSDRPNATDGLSADELKERFDKAGNDIKSYINGTLTTEVDTLVGNYYTKSQIDSNIYTKTQVDNKFGSYYTKTQSDTNYYSKSQVDNKFGNYYTKTESNNNYYTKTQSDNNYYTKAQINTTLGSYYTKTQVDSALGNYQKKITYGTGDPSGGNNGDVYIKYS